MHRNKTVAESFSFIRTIPSAQELHLICWHSIVEPIKPLAGYTAGGELHPALRMPDYSGRDELGA